MDIHNLLQQGKVILYDTDTVPGLGCDALNAESVAKIFEIKHRPTTKSCIILVSSLDMLRPYIDYEKHSNDVDQIIKNVYNQNNNPTTIVIYGKGLPDMLISQDGSIAVRLIEHKHPLSHIIETFGYPIVSTSANMADEATPQTMDQVDSRIKNAVDEVLTFDIPGTGKPSSIISLLGEEIQIIR